MAYSSLGEFYWEEISKKTHACCTSLTEQTAKQPESMSVGI